MFAALLAVAMFQLLAAGEARADPGENLPPAESAEPVDPSDPVDDAEDAGDGDDSDDTDDTDDGDDAGDDEDESAEAARSRIDALLEEQANLRRQIEEMRARLRERTQQRDQAEQQLAATTRELEGEEEKRQKLAEALARPFGVALDITFTAGGPGAYFGAFLLDDNAPVFTWAFGIEFHLPGFMVTRFQFDFAVVDAFDDENKVSESSRFDVYLHVLPLRLGFAHHSFPQGLAWLPGGAFETDELLVTYGYLNTALQPYPGRGDARAMLSVSPIVEIAIDLRSGGLDLRTGIGVLGLVTATINLNIDYHTNTEAFGALHLAGTLPIIIFGGDTLNLSADPHILPGWELLGSDHNWMTPLLTLTIDYTVPLDHPDYEHAVRIALRFHFSLGG